MTYSLITVWFRQAVHSWFSKPRELIVSVGDLETASTSALTPGLVLILSPGSDVVAPRQHPLHPPTGPARLARHEALDALRVRAAVGAVGLVEAELGHDHGRLVRVGSVAEVHGAVAVVVQAGRDVAAGAGAVLVVVQLEDELLGEAEAGRDEVLAVAQVLAVSYG